MQRLGHKLYYPIGLDWYYEGYWKIAAPYGNPIVTIKQFLDINEDLYDPHKNLNGNYTVEDDIYTIYDPGNKYYRHGITLDKFKDMDIDIVIASYIDHIIPYHDLIMKYKPGAKLVHQMGNNWQHQIPYSHVKNILASTAHFNVPAGVASIFYHQEFPLDVFSYTDPSNVKNINSFVNLLPKADLYNALKSRLSEYDFHAYGSGSPDGCINEIEDIANIMQNSMFGYHYKPEGDGYGHILHNWFAVGRPIIVNYDDYRQTLGGSLLIPDKTCIAFNGNNIDEVCAKVAHFSQEEPHKQMCVDVYKQFKNTVDFDTEAKAIDTFLHNLN
jgi:hypothetical protein